MESFHSLPEVQFVPAGILGWWLGIVPVPSRAGPELGMLSLPVLPGCPQMVPSTPGCPGSQSQGSAPGSSFSPSPHQHLFASKAPCNQDLIRQANLKEVLHLHGKRLQFGFPE